MQTVNVYPPLAGTVIGITPGEGQYSATVTVDHGGGVVTTLNNCDMATVAVNIGQTVSESTFIAVQPLLEEESDG